MSMGVCVILCWEVSRGDGNGVTALLSTGRCLTLEERRGVCVCVHLLALDLGKET